jgi:hypothetical protein
MLLSVLFPLTACATTVLALPTSLHAPFDARAPQQGIVVGSIPSYWKGVDNQLYSASPSGAVIVPGDFRRLTAFVSSSWFAVDSRNTNSRES